MARPALLGGTKMDAWLWSGLKLAALVIAFAIAAYVWEKTRNAVSARIGLGRFYNRLPRPVDDQRLIENLEHLGDYFLERSVAQMAHDSPVDWKWRMGEDLKRIAELARNGIR